ncbi:MAG TPA: amidohydrolase family protein [Streptosporangiaceae bacterium]|nr:amidohydrolase family protein [Streptosporangiaceae bacterium]
MDSLRRPQGGVRGVGHRHAGGDAAAADRPVSPRRAAVPRQTCWQLIRYPNLYASIAATVNFVVRAPRMFAEILGKLLFWCGEDKIIYGSEAPLWHPQWALRAFMDFQIPEDLCAGYGYPQLTDQAKRKILGENLLRLHGMDLAEARTRAAR